MKIIQYYKSYLLDETCIAGIDCDTGMALETFVCRSNAASLADKPTLS